MTFSSLSDSKPHARAVRKPLVLDGVPVIVERLVRDVPYQVGNRFLVGKVEVDYLEFTLCNEVASWPVVVL